MNNETSVSIKFSNSVTGEKKLEKYAETLSKINSIINAIDTGKSKGMENALKEPTKDAGKLEKGLSTAFNTAKITAFIASINKLTKTISGYTKKSATYLENMNLLDVAFGNNTNEAKQFINTLSEMYGLDESWGTRTVGIFKQLANAMGLADEVGTKMSKTLTQLAIDTSSLYNIDVEDTVSILQSALAGQTKPARRLGADITQSTLQLTMDTAGIDRTIESLTYAEKRLVIVASLLNQTQQSFGDWGRTIESVANQMRIMQQQTERLTRAIGNVFLPILKIALPYINAVLMVLTEIVSWLAVLVGYKEEDFDFFGETDQSVLDLSDGLASATENAKKLKSGLRGFDKLNNITTPSNAGAGVGAGAGGVDPEILNLFNKASDNYMKSLDKVEMKATKIRDRIMEWLGFTKEINEETGDISFKFERITGGTVLGGLGVGGFIYSGIAKVVKLLNKLGIVNFTLPSFGDMVKNFSKVVGFSGAIDDIAIGIKGWATGAWSFKEAMSLVGPALGTIAKVAGAIGIAIAGVGVAIDGINRIIEGETFKGIMELISGIATVVGGVALAFGSLPVAIGGAVVAGITAIVAFWDEICNFFKNVWDWIDTNMLQPVIDFFEPLAQWFDQTVIQPIIKYIVPIIDKIVEIYNKIVEIFTALKWAFNEYVINPIKEYVINFYNENIKPVIDGFKLAWQIALDYFKEKFWNPLVEKWNSFKTLIQNVKDWVVNAFKWVGEQVGNFFSLAIKNTVNALFGAIENKINGFIKLLNKAINKINEIPGVNIKTVSELKIPRLKTGLDFVPSDYFPAYLDYGERVLTKEQNADYNKGIINGQSVNNGRPINATFVIKVGDREIAKQVINDLQDIAKDNGKPITIGG